MNKIFERVGRSFRAGRAQHIGHTVLQLKEGQFELFDRAYGSLSAADDGTVTLVARRDGRDVHTDLTVRVVPGEFEHSPVELTAWRSECRDGVDPVIAVYPPQEGVPVLGLHAVREIADAAYRAQRQRVLAEPIAG